MSSLLPSTLYSTLYIHISNRSKPPNVPRFHSECTIRFYTEHCRSVSNIIHVLQAHHSTNPDVPCGICGLTDGVLVRCAFGQHCQALMHPLCARNVGMYVTTKKEGTGRGTARMYCDRHGHIQRAKDLAKGGGGGRGGVSGEDLEQHALTAAQERKLQKEKALQQIASKEREYMLLHDVRLELEQIRLMLERITRREKQKKAVVTALRELHEAQVRHVGATMGQGAGAGQPPLPPPPPPPILDVDPIPAPRPLGEAEGATTAASPAPEIFLPPPPALLVAPTAGGAGVASPSSHQAKKAAGGKAGPGKKRKEPTPPGAAPADDTQGAAGQPATRGGRGGGKKAKTSEAEAGAGGTTAEEPPARRQRPPRAAAASLM